MRCILWILCKIYFSLLTNNTLEVVTILKRKVLTLLSRGLLLMLLAIAEPKEISTNSTPNMISESSIRYRLVCGHSNKLKNESSQQSMHLHMCNRIFLLFNGFIAHFNLGSTELSCQGIDPEHWRLTPRKTLVFRCFVNFILILVHVTAETKSSDSFNPLFFIFLKMKR